MRNRSILFSLLALALAATLAHPLQAQRPAPPSPATEPAAAQLSDEQVQALSDAVARAVAESLQGRSPRASDDTATRTPREPLQVRTPPEKEPIGGKAPRPLEPVGERGKTPIPLGERGKQQVSPTPAAAAMTLFVDIGPASRRDGAAKKLNEVYATQARLGWAVLDVDLYVEDGDLEGFFVTFVRAE